MNLTQRITLSFLSLFRESKDEDERRSLQLQINSLSNRMDRLKLELSLMKGRKNWYNRSKMDASVPDGLS